MYYGIKEKVAFQVCNFQFLLASMILQEKEEAGELLAIFGLSSSAA